MTEPTSVVALRGLYAVTPDDYLLPRLSALVRAALTGGARLVQYRNKTAPAALRRAQAAELLRVCHAQGAKLIINDDYWLALEIGADGAHIGRHDIPAGSLQAARDALGPQRILGVSCYASLDLAAAAAAAGADYLAFGSMFPSLTKPLATPASFDVVTAAKHQFGLPVAAIGGITLANGGAVIAAGADMLAVVSDLFNPMNITARAAAFQALWPNDGDRQP